MDDTRVSSYPVQTRLTPRRIAHLLFLTPEQLEEACQALREHEVTFGDEDRNLDALWEKVGRCLKPGIENVKGCVIPLVEGELEALIDLVKWHRDSLEESLRQLRDRERNRRERERMAAPYRRSLALAETIISKAKMLRGMAR